MSDRRFISMTDDEHMTDEHASDEPTTDEHEVSTEDARAPGQTPPDAAGEAADVAEGVVERERADAGSRRSESNTDRDTHEATDDMADTADADDQAGGAGDGAEDAADEPDPEITALVERAVSVMEDRHDLPKKPEEEQPDEPRYETCGAKTRSEDAKGEYCRLPSGFGTDNEDGRCKFHGGATPTADENPRQGRGDIRGNANAETHGLFSEKKKWYMRKDPETKEAIHRLHRTWLQHANQPDAAAPVLWDAAINEFRLGQAEAYFEEDELLEENVVRDAEGELVYDDTGEPVTKRDEHPALMPRSRMQRDTLKILKDTGVLGTDGGSGDGNTLAEAIAEVLAEKEDDDGDDDVVDVDAEVRDA